MMCIISKQNCILRTGRRNARRDICSVTHRIAIPMQARTRWTHSDVLSLLATTPEWSFKIGDRQNAKRQWSSDRRAIYNATHCIDAGCGVIRHRGVSDGSDGARPLWQSHSARTEYFFADAPSHLPESQVSSFRSIANCLSIATTMNSLLQTMISVLCTQGNGAAWLNASECFWYSQPSMHRWQDSIAASDRPHKA